MKLFQKDSLYEAAAGMLRSQPLEESPSWKKHPGEIAFQPPAGIPDHFEIVGKNKLKNGDTVVRRAKSYLGGGSEFLVVQKQAPKGDKFYMVAVSTQRSGAKRFAYYGTHPSADGAMKMAKNQQLIESTELEEAKITGKQRERLDDLITLYYGATDPNGYYDDEDLDADEILDMVKKEFGSKIAKDLEDGSYIMHFPRYANLGSRLDYGDATKHRDGNRITKAGKLNKQDAATMKKRIKDILKKTKMGPGFRSHALKGKLPESTELEEGVTKKGLKQLDDFLNSNEQSKRYKKSFYQYFKTPRFNFELHLSDVDIDKYIKDPSNKDWNKIVRNFEALVIKKQQKLESTELEEAITPKGIDQSLWKKLLDAVTQEHKETNAIPYKGVSPKTKKAVMDAISAVQKKYGSSQASKYVDGAYATVGWDHQNKKANVGPFKEDYDLNEEFESFFE